MTHHQSRSRQRRDGELPPGLIAARQTSAVRWLPEEKSCPDPGMGEGGTGPPAGTWALRGGISLPKNIHTLSQAVHRAGGFLGERLDRAAPACSGRELPGARLGASVNTRLCLSLAGGHSASWERGPRDRRGVTFPGGDVPVGGPFPNVTHPALQDSSWFLFHPGAPLLDILVHLGDFRSHRSKRPERCLKKK